MVWVAPELEAVLVPDTSSEGGGVVAEGGAPN